MLANAASTTETNNGAANISPFDARKVVVVGSTECGKTALINR
jgi:GTPase SAR1 family protein